MAHPELVAPVATRCEESAAWLAEMLARYLGPAITGAFGDEDVTEIYVNPQDNAVRVDTRSRGKRDTGDHLPAHRIELFLNAVATSLNLTLTAEQPRLQAELPRTTFHGSRLQGFIPPLVAGPTFTIRKPSSVVHSLHEYVMAEILTADQCTVLRAAVAAHENILVAGGTNSGKTTLANALLREVTDQFPEERLVILEDTVELQCTANDHLTLRTGPQVTLAELVRSTLRTSPNRIIVGEVRGPEALDLLDAWATGHPGGIATVHASSAEGALNRLDRLAQRANVPPQSALVAEAIDLVVVIAGGNAGRRVTDLARVTGLDDRGRYALHHLTEQRS
jgi:P-type conjugative transfer ATPase TrbB